MIKNTARIFILLICVCLLYTTAMYGYVWFKMQPLTPITAISNIQSNSIRPAIYAIHAVNSVRRAQAKQKRYTGLEIDINRKDGQLVAAHDESHFDKAIPLEDIFAALSHPEEKTFWMDLKINLTQEEINQLKALARRYHIHPRRMLFETKGGETADLLTRNGFPILLQISSDFAQDHADPARRAQLNAELEEQLRRYQPFAIAASLGKYPYLQAYFPHYNKAIYSSTTVRPSLKKYFLTRAMLADPTVRIWMQEEYTALPF